MSKALSPEDRITAVRTVLTILNQLTGEGSLAGIILTSSSYDAFKRMLPAETYRVAEIDLDPQMEHSFVVDGLLILRGTQLNG